MKKIGVRGQRSGVREGIFFLLFFLTPHPSPLTPSLWAIGVKSITGKIHVENVPLGSTVSLRNISGKVYRVMNTSESPYEFSVDLSAPIEGDLIGDFEPLPNFEWVKLAKTDYHLAPGQEALVDIVFSFPNDDKLLGKKFVCFIVSGNVSKPEEGMGVAARVKSKFTMTLAKDRLTDEQREKIKNIRQRLEFNVVPSILDVEGFPKGKKTDLKKLSNKTFKIINPNNEPIKITLEIVKPSQAGMKPKLDFIEGPPDWLTLHNKRKMTVIVKADTIYNIPLELLIPPAEQNRKFLFGVKVTLEGFDVPVNSYGRLYIVAE
ncbi:MAG: hypothetical protein HY401_06105 [Elusimicrobia bacterium]|nr:hypothetical protein [Elusimicrobiota bacterium]